MLVYTQSLTFLLLLLSFRMSFIKPWSISLLKPRLHNHNPLLHRTSPTFNKDPKQTRLLSSYSLDSLISSSSPPFSSSTPPPSSPSPFYSNFRRSSSSTTPPTNNSTTADQNKRIDMKTVTKIIKTLHDLSKSTSELYGVGPKTSSHLAHKSLNLKTIRSILFNFPIAIIDRTRTSSNVNDFEDGALVTIVLRVDRFYARDNAVKVECRDKSDNKVTLNYSFYGGGGAVNGIRSLFDHPARRGVVAAPLIERVVSGKIQRNHVSGAFEMTAPDIVKPVEELSSVLRVEPVYKLTKGLTSSRMQKAVTQSLLLADSLLESVPESMNLNLLDKLGWPTLRQALTSAHSPVSLEDLAPSSKARMRLAFEELSFEGTVSGLLNWKGEGRGEYSIIRNNWLSVAPHHHFSLISSASLRGRRFLNQSKEDVPSTLNMMNEHTSAENFILNEAFLSSESVKSNAASSSGLAMRVNLALFGSWSEDCEEQMVSNTYLYETLTQFHRGDASNSELDEEVEEAFAKFAEMVVVGEENFSKIEKAKPKESAKKSSTSTSTLERDQSTLEPRLPLATSENICFIVFDVETSGLNPNTNNVIQIAAKVLGANGKDEQFSAYIRLPATHERLTKMIEKLTGISDEFLRYGGIEPFTGVAHDAAPDFESVYVRFCEWCVEQRQGRDICLLAHNSRFDIKMLNSEIRRLASERKRFYDKFESVDGEDREEFVPPSLKRDAQIACVVDTLTIFRTKSLWASEDGGGGVLVNEKLLSQPDSFKQGDVYQRVCGASMRNAHNAMGDIVGLEEILFSPHIEKEWRQIAERIQIVLVV